MLDLGFEAGQRHDFRGFFRAMSLVGGLSGWDAPTLAIVALPYYDAGDCEEAKRLFSEALAKDPDDPTVLMCYGRYLQQNGRSQQALDYLGRALAKRPGDPWILGWLGTAHWALGQIDEAERCYAESLQKDSSSRDAGWAYTGLGHIAARRENWDKAAHFWREAAKRLPQNEEIWYNLGDALLDAGEYREAVRALRRSLRLGSERPAWTHYDLARCYQQLGDIRRARTACEQALRYEPQDQETLDLKSELETSQVPERRAE